LTLDAIKRARGRSARVGKSSARRRDAGSVEDAGTPAASNSITAGFKRVW
jgi:hypothetical protein